MAHIYDTAEKAAVADERQTLEAFLDYYRDVMKAKSSASRRKTLGAASYPP